MADDLFTLGEEQVSLADLAGISMDEFTEVRGFGLPRGVFHLLVKEAKLNLVGDPKMAVAQFGCEVRRVIELSEPEGIDVDGLVGKVHNETFFIKEPKDDIGRIKAFLADIGANASGTSLHDAVNGAAGCEFVGQITHQTSKKDPDRVYINLKRDKLKAVQPGAAAA